MAQLWAINVESSWAVVPLSASGFSLTSDGPRPRGTEEPGEFDGPALAMLLRSNQTPAGSWILVCGRDDGVRVNGRPLHTGLRVLVDRDEIRHPLFGRLYFSTELLARVEPFVGGGQKFHCPRCKLAIDPGVSAVRCPQCGVWHHETPELNCWTYSPTCALCPQPSRLDAGYRWTPDGL